MSELSSTRLGLFTKDNLTYRCKDTGRDMFEAGCREISSVIFYNEISCVKSACGSPWRICIACLLVGEADLGRKVVNAVTGLCQFHDDHGRGARASDFKEKKKSPLQDLEKQDLEEIAFLPEELKEVISPVLEGAAAKLLVSDVYPNPNQPRKVFSKESIDRLGKSILSEGQETAITVIKTEEGFKIVEGERRWRACKLKGIKSIYANVSYNSEINLLEVSAVSNIGREDFTAMEYAKTAEKMITDIALAGDENGKPLKKVEIKERVATALCMSVITLNKYLSLLKLHPKIQEQIVIHSRDPNTGITSGLAHELSKIPDHKKQLELLERIKKGRMSVDRAKMFLSRIREEGDVGSPEIRKRQPSDDYAVLLKSLDIIGDRIMMISDMGPEKLVKMFFNREELERRQAINRLRGLITKLDKISKIILNEGSLKEYPVDDSDDTKS